jgi:DNA-binding CsgD family transcriptional regulator
MSLILSAESGEIGSKVTPIRVMNKKIPRVSFCGYNASLSLLFSSELTRAAIMSPNKIIDTSRELCVYRYGEGLKLIRPDRKIKHPSLFMQDTGYTIADMLALPCGVYFYNHQSRFQNINDRHAESCGFVSEREALGKTVLDTSIAKYARHLIHHNETIMAMGHMKLFDEEIIHHDGTYNQGISIKAPWYDDEDNMLGVIGCTIVSGKHSMASSLAKIAELHLLSPKAMPQLKRANADLTKRETEVLYCLVKGKTAKKIGDILGISHRTVEQHIERIKAKMNVFSKSELIEKAIDQLIV